MKKILFCVLIGAAGIVATDTQASFLGGVGRSVIENMDNATDEDQKEIISAVATKQKEIIDLIVAIKKN